MILRDLLAGFATTVPSPDREITELALDSRRVRPGTLFFAVPGDSGDGRAFIADAIARGAAAVVYESANYTPPAGLAVPAMGVADLKQQIGPIAERFYGAPSTQLFVVGVTGTNGKTTCTQLLARALVGVGQRCAVIGTLGNGFPGALQAATHTTPDAVRLHALLAEFHAAGASHISMEVSSHALDQRRVDGIAFNGVVFTNLTRDHLDYHGDMDAYGRAKARLFDWPDLRFAVINVDDPFGRALCERIGDRVKVWSFGLHAGEVRATDIHPLPDGFELHIETPVGAVTVRTALLGRFNVENLLAVLATLLACGVPLDEVLAQLRVATPVPGRLERFRGANTATVVVDYAHTPDALEQALRALREHAPGRLWCVFGCGGDRDRGKRPLMGAIAERLADTVVLTDDNPRHESPEQIIADIVAGMQSLPRVMRDRAQAIRTVIDEARAGEIVLLAGKGHEDYQQIGDTRVPFSDRDFVRDLLKVAA
jgi:UDP-N-acetylmuramoyl-L-alanyl-D-glutamate--2,6-diaminopimelate ligase